MPLPLVAVVGRPNVGKSTFVNRIAQANEAIVHEMRGVTRDRSYHEADWNGVEFKLVDTGGIEMGDDDAFQGSIRAQAIAGANEADVVVFVVDGKTGINADDEEVARILRKTRKPVFLAVNKMDTPNRTDELWEFYQLGLGDPWPVSATHGHGTGDLLDAVVDELRKADLAGGVEEDGGINVAIIGRPNAGKSSLTNRLTANERSIVSDVAGTTRDAIDTRVERDGRRYTIVDTAGLRRKSQIDQDVEYYGFVRAMRAIDRADVALLVIDSTLGLTDQDQRVAGFAAERGCAMVVVLNKWDLVDGPEAKAEIRERIADRLTFVGYAPVIAISALTGKKVERVWDAIDGRVRELLPDHPHEQAEHLAGRDQGDGAHGVERQGRPAHEVRHADLHVPAALHVLREPPRPRHRQLRAIPREPFARALRLDGHAHPDEVQEEGLVHADGSGGGSRVRRVVSAGVDPLGRDHLEGVLPHRHPRARQRQHRHHERPAHDGQGRRRGGVSARLRQGLASGGLALAACWLLVAGRRALVRTLRLLRSHGDACVSRLHLGPYLQPVARLQGGQGIAVAVGCLFASVRLARGAARARAVRRSGGGDALRVARVACGGGGLPVLRAPIFWGEVAPIMLCTLAAATVIWAHRSNIARLRAGSESRIGKKKA